MGGGRKRRLGIENEGEIMANREKKSAASPDPH